LDTEQNDFGARLLSESNDHVVFVSSVSFSPDEDDLETVEPDEESVEVEIIGYVVVDFNKDALHQVQRSIFMNNSLTGGLVAILLGIFMNWVVGRMTRPLKDLSQTMKTARDVKYYPRAQLNGAAEIQLIAKAYNRLMDSLERQNNELELHRDTLESEVEMRTSELLTARDTALTASRHKSEFLANISHELRTPLQAVIGYNDLVREELELECMDTQVDDLNKSIRSANHLLDLINNILDIAKIEAGRMDLYLKPVDMKLLVDETLENIIPIAKANHNVIEVIREGLSSNLVIDRQKVMQIFLNLLSNACKFTKNGKITFTIHNDNYYLYFVVKDTGVGISNEDQEIIFEPFIQVDGSQTRKFEGTGLGMAITKNFCDLMNGQILVESELNIGTIFNVKLQLPSS
jgi:signal transduction histidine kinase